MFFNRYFFLFFISLLTMKNSNHLCFYHITTWFQVRLFICVTSFMDDTLKQIYLFSLRFHCCYIFEEGVCNMKFHLRPTLTLALTYLCSATSANTAMSLRIAVHIKLLSVQLKFTSKIRKGKNLYSIDETLIGCFSKFPRYLPFLTCEMDLKSSVILSKLALLYNRNSINIIQF